MADTGATSHIINDVTKLIGFDKTSRPKTHRVELADAVGLHRSRAQVLLIDSGGQQRSTMLRDACFIQTGRAVHGAPPPL